MTLKLQYWELLKRLRFVPTDRVIQFLLMALCVPAGSSSYDSTGHIEAVPAAYEGNSPKRLGKDLKGNTIVHPPALPEDHMPDFHHYDDARDIWMAVKARFGGNEESKKMRKTMLKK
nr:xylulose kinase-1 [Tanacetum cinerariifolium]